jgi:hypothetical protein
MTESARKRRVMADLSEAAELRSCRGGTQNGALWEGKPSLPPDDPTPTIFDFDRSAGFEPESTAS